MKQHKNLGGGRLRWNRVPAEQEKSNSIFEGRLRSHELAAKKKAPTNSIPPWMKKDDYLSLHAPVPDDFGIPDIMTPSQWANAMRAPDPGPQTPDEKMAWKFLYINMSDCLCGKQNSRLDKIEEISLWMIGKKRIKKEVVEFDFFYTFDLWCEYLNVDGDYMREGMGRFLQAAKHYATTDEKPKHLRDLLNTVGQYRPRRGINVSGVSRKQRNAEHGSEMLDTGLLEDAGLYGDGGRGSEDESGRGCPSGPGASFTRGDAGRVHTDLSGLIPAIQRTICADGGPDAAAKARELVEDIGRVPIVEWTE